ncbi:MAG: endonuclease domain-containing protein [Legionellales bacterium]
MIVTKVNASFAKTLRQQSTLTEIKLWGSLRGRRFFGLKFRRQYPLGPYVVDFICIEKKLIIEIDGSQHMEQTEYDAHRTNYLNNLGYNVVRFWNHDVFNQIDLVKEQIHLSVFNA